MSIVARLDRLPLGRFHWSLLGLTGVIWFFASFNTTMLSFILVAIIAQWSLPPFEAGLIGSSVVMGMAIGAIGIGTFSDRYGRKRAAELAVITLCVSTALAALVDNYFAFIALRFVTGLSLGGITPVLITLISEFSPSGRRGTLMNALEIFWSMGLFTSAAVASVLMPAYGWQVTMAVGAVPIFYLLVVRLALPESPRFLLDKGRYDEADAVVSRVERGYARGLPPIARGDLATGEVVDRAGVVVKAGMGELLAPPLRRRTFSLWTINFCLVLTYYGIFTWLPALLVAAGHPIQRAFELFLAMGLAQLPGKVLAAYISERFGRKWTIAPFYVLYGISAFFLGQSNDAGAIFFWACALSFVNAVVFGTVLAFTAESYPTRARSTGAGTAFAVSRLGGVCGPLLVGFMLGIVQGNQAIIFAVFGASMIVAAGVLVLFGEETKGRSLEEIAK